MQFTLSFYFCLVIYTISVCLGKQNTGSFWHITDIHVDQNYSRTGNPNDLCHKDKASYPDNGLYGNFLCDSPEYLVNVTFQAMRRIKPDPDFIIWTGDNLPHTSIFDPDWSVIFQALYNISLLFENHFPKIPVYPCIGNHDTFPPNILIPSETTTSIYSDILTKGGWNKFLKDEQSVSTFVAGGFYSKVIGPGLRIMSLNTILWYTPNNFTEKMSDPLNQLMWMENVLKNSSKSSEMVYIIGHVPPGFYNRVIPGQKSSPTFHPQFLEAYLGILKKYTNIIKGQMFGHLHMDMFQLFQLDSGHFLGSSLLASSVTPWHFQSKDNVSIPVNPSIRLLHYDHLNGLLKDYEQFYLNLTKANMNDSEESSFYELLYTFTKAYNVPDVTTESLVAVYEKIKNNKMMFLKFFKYSTAGKDSVKCDINCKVAQLCSISSTSIDEYNSCMETILILSGSLIDRNNYSGYVTFGVVILILCTSAFLFVIIRRHKQKQNEMYSKF